MPGTLVSLHPCTLPARERDAVWSRIDGALRVRVLSQSYEEALKVASAREQKVKEVFDKYDTDNSRTIDTKELLSLLSDLGLTEKLKTDSKVFEKEMMDKYDTNKDGVLRCGQLLFFGRPRLSSHAAPCTHTHTRAALTRGWCDAIDV